MRTRRLALAAVVIAVLTSLIASASPALAASAVSCSTKGSTIATTKSARVFKVTVRKIARLYGCATATRRISYLGRVGGEGIDPSVIAVTGPRVAYVRTFCGEGGCLLRVFVQDLKQRKELASADAAPSDPPQRLTDIVLTAGGTAAWISELEMPAARYVFAAKQGSPVIPIATGLNIVPGSLALAGKRLYWLQPTALSVVLP